MTAYDVAFKFLGIIEPFAGYIIGFFLLWLVTIISDRSLASLLKELINEFGGLLERKADAKSANALGLLLMFVLILFLFHGRLGDIVLPKGGDHGPGLMVQGLNVFLVLIFGGSILISLKIAHYQK